MSGLATNRRSLIAPAPPTVWNYTVKDGINTAVEISYRLILVNA